MSTLEAVLDTQINEQPAGATQRTDLGLASGPAIHGWTPHD